MNRIVHVNGAYVPENEASVSIFDRGFLMGDAVYEVTAVLEGKLLEFPAHMARLERSLGELEIPFPVEQEALLALHRELINQNNLENGMIYMQVSRGPADRDFAFPENPKPTIIAFTQAMDWLEAPFVEQGFRIKSHPEGRWARRDIKTTQILWTSMSKMAALRAGVDDVWYVEDGHVTEGSACNAFIIKDGAIISHALTNDILHGVTRAVVMGFAKEVGLKVDERPFTIAEAQQADEAFVTASPLFAAGVVEIDNVQISDGKPGPLTMKLRNMHIEASLKDAV